VKRAHRGTYNDRVAAVAWRSPTSSRTPKLASRRSPSAAPRRSLRPLFGKESARLHDQLGPMIIIAGSGMVTGARIIGHLREGGPSDRTTVLFVGYQGVGTPAGSSRRPRSTAAASGSTAPTCRCARASPRLRGSRRTPTARSSSAGCAPSPTCAGSPSTTATWRRSRPSRRGRSAAVALADFSLRQRQAAAVLAAKPSQARNLA